MSSRHDMDLFDGSASRMTATSSTSGARPSSSHCRARTAGAGGAAAGDGAIISPMPGKIIALEVAAGEAVTKGQKLLTLEAMKMEHSLVAPFDGMVAELNAEAGAQVSEGALLARIEKGEDDVMSNPFLPSGGRDHARSAAGGAGLGSARAGPLRHRLRERSPSPRAGRSC